MIQDARVLQTGFLPGDVQYRDSQVTQLSEALEPTNRDEPPETAFLFGPTRAGKTCIARYSLTALREDVLDVTTQYVNCLENYSAFRTLYRILDGMGRTLDVHRQSSPTESGAASPTAAHVHGVEVPPCPERPADLTRDTARRFTVRFEAAYASRLAVPEDADDVTAVTVRVESDAVEETDDGWLVHLQAFSPTYTAPTPTPSPHSDPGFHYVSYYVSAETLLRARGGGERVDPRTNGEEPPGEPVSCPP